MLGLRTCVNLWLLWIWLWNCNHDWFCSFAMHAFALYLLEILSLMSFWIFLALCNLVMVFLASYLDWTLSQVKEVAPAARRRDARLSFAFVYPDKNGRFVVREVRHSLWLQPTFLCEWLSLSYSYILHHVHVSSDYGKLLCFMKVGKTYSNRNGKLDDGKALAELGFQVEEDTLFWRHVLL